MHEFHPILDLTRGTKSCLSSKGVGGAIILSLMPIERHVSLISLPDFGVPKNTEQFASGYSENYMTKKSYDSSLYQTNNDSFLLTQREEATQLITSAPSTVDASKFHRGKVDLAAAFRRQVNFSVKPKTIRKSIPRMNESIYSTTSTHNGFHYEPKQFAKKFPSDVAVLPNNSRCELSRHHQVPSVSIRETATFGDNTSQYTSDHYSAYSNTDIADHCHFSSPGRQSETMKQKKCTQPLSKQYHVYEPSETEETFYATHYPQTIQRSNRGLRLRGSRSLITRGRSHKYNRSPRIYPSVGANSHLLNNNRLMQAMTTGPFSTFPMEPLPFQPSGRLVAPFSYPHPFSVYPQAIMAAPPVQQPCAALQFSAISPIASRSMLTCSRDFQAQFPNVYSGLCKGLIDVNRLIQHEVVIPVKEEITLHKNTIRSHRAVVASISEQLWKPLHGKFPDPSIAPKLVKKVSEYFFGRIEGGIQQAEDERSVLQWLFRFDVDNAIEIRVTTSLGVGSNSAISNIEGAAHVKRRKGDLFSLLAPDTVTVDMDIVIKALFLNGGQLTEINNDPIFIDRVQGGGNRFAASFIDPH